MNLLSEEYHLEQIKNGNIDSFEIYFKFYYRRLCIYLRTIVQDKEVIEEIVQELFIHIWENRKSIDPYDNYRSYVYVSARNRVLNYFKGEKAKIRLLENLKYITKTSENNVEQTLNEKELSLAYNKSIDELPPKCREIFVLIKFNDLTYQEASKILGLSIKTIETQMGRALRRIRISLQEYKY